MSAKTAQYYEVRSGQHRNNHNLSITIGNEVIRLYTDGNGLMREIRDSEGHPFIRQEIAEIFAQQPADAGWVVLPRPADAPEPPEEIVPVDVSDVGAITFTSDRIAGRLKEALLSAKEKDTLLAIKDQQIAQLNAKIAKQEEVIGELQRDNNRLLAEKEAYQPERPAVPQRQAYSAPAAPMVNKRGKYTKAQKGKSTDLVANDSSVGTLRDQDPGNPIDLGGLDDIPRVEE